MKNIGIDIGKKTCIVCVTDSKGKILEETHYSNTLKDAKKYAVQTREKYGQCRAVLESTGNMWNKTCDAFEGAGIPVRKQLAVLQSRIRVR